MTAHLHRWGSQSSGFRLSRITWTDRMRRGRRLAIARPSRWLFGIYIDWLPKWRSRKSSIAGTRLEYRRSEAGWSASLSPLAAKRSITRRWGSAKLGPGGTSSILQSNGLQTTT